MPSLSAVAMRLLSSGRLPPGKGRNILHEADVIALIMWLGFIDNQLMAAVFSLWRAVTFSSGNMVKRANLMKYQWVSSHRLSCQTLTHCQVYRMFLVTHFSATLSTIPPHSQYFLINSRMLILVSLYNWLIANCTTVSHERWVKFLWSHCSDFGLIRPPGSCS